MLPTAGYGKWGAKLEGSMDSSCSLTNLGDLPATLGGAIIQKGELSWLTRMKKTSRYWY